MSDTLLECTTCGTMRLPVRPATRTVLAQRLEYVDAVLQGREYPELDDAGRVAYLRGFVAQTVESMRRTRPVCTCGGRLVRATSR